MLFGFFGPVESAWLVIVNGPDGRFLVQLGQIFFELLSAAFVFELFLDFGLSVFERFSTGIIALDNTDNVEAAIAFDNLAERVRREFK